ncbi:uncharacterized protein A4U43_C09F9250, partial [Asparagus officinalis]
MSYNRKVQSSQSSSQKMLEKYKKLHIVYEQVLDESHLQEYRRVIEFLDVAGLGSMKDKGRDKANVS